MRHVPALDGLRGIAILAVLLCHFSARYSGFLRPLYLGWAGVDLFFVLSGFLITTVLVETRGAPGYYRNFYARRVLRIFPLYYAALAVLMMGGLALEPGALWLWFYGGNVQIAMNGWIANHGHGWISANHFWSLSVEEHFYLAWPLVIAMVPPARMRRVCLGIAVAALAYRCALVGCEHWIAAGENYLAAYVSTPARVDGIALGALVAVLRREGRFAALARHAPVVAAAGAALVIGWCGSAGPGWERSAVVETVGHSVLALTFVAVLVLVLDGGTAARICSAAWLRFLGRYSYGIYVIHLPVACWLDAYPQPPWWIDVPAKVGLSIGLALVSWHLLEKRCLALKRHFEARST